jgi:hypothetical protein
MSQIHLVLVYMAGNGKGKAMTTTLHLKLSYPQIQLPLVVGVCGGTGYTGPTVCPSGWKCTYQNAHYSQCKF